MDAACICGLAGLAAATFCILGFVFLALSSKWEGRKGEIALLALGGLLLLACVCAGVVMISALVTMPTPTLTPIPTFTLAPTPISTSTPAPTLQPTTQPTHKPTIQPTNQPTIQPTLPPSLSYPIDLTPYSASLLPDEQAAVSVLDDPPIYTLDVRVDWARHTVAGVETLLYTNNEGVALDRLYLRLYPNAPYYEEGRTDIGPVTLDGQPVRAEVDETVLEITLPQPLQPEERITLTIPFTVTVPHRPDRFGYEDNVMMLGHWYPLLAVYDEEGWNLDPYVAMGDAFYSETGFYTVHLTVPEGTVVASTGVETARVEQGDETRITLVSTATRDFTLALSPDYRTLTRQVGQTRVTSFYLPGDKEGARRALDTASRAVEIFSARFGLYPYTDFDVAETPFLIEGSPGGMEYPGLVFISSDLYDPEGFYAAAFAVIVAHETAHQWWYSVVGNNQVDEPWLDEAFATYAQILYVEETAGQTAARETEALWVEFPYMMAAMMGEDRPVATSLLDFDDTMLYSAIVYSKGALFLRGLRSLVGDETFFAILQHHYQTYRYGIVPADGFRRSIAEVTDNDPDALALYDLWILSDETPPEFEMPGFEIPGEESDDWEEIFRRLEELFGEGRDKLPINAEPASRVPVAPLPAARAPRPHRLLHLPRRLHHRV